jgi:hypothetical protein
LWRSTKETLARVPLGEPSRIIRRSLESTCKIGARALNLSLTRNFSGETTKCRCH